MKMLRFFFALMMLGLVAGCATSSNETAKKGPTETCHVCRYNNDLSCVCVNVNASTPRTSYQGTNYFFCSDDCRKDFEKRPTKYLPKR